MYRIVFFGLIFLIGLSCKTNQVKSNSTTSASLITLDSLFKGSYSNQSQANSQSGILNLNLNIYPLTSWNDQTTHWFYIEEFPKDNHSHQFNQKVYKFIKEANHLRCKSFAVIDPYKYVVADSGIHVLNRLTIQKLKESKGCDLIFNYTLEGYRGNSEAKNCVSNINGAEYSTTFINILKNKIEYWERGMAGDTVQVWGSSQAYIFNKII